MRILIDYRPALKQRTGVGEYVHQLASALARQRVDRSIERRAGDRRASLNADQVDLFTSSWKDRPSAQTLAEVGRLDVLDRRIPVKLLNFCWHRLEMPPVEWLTGRHYEVVHSPTPLLLPSRRAARIVTIHDLDFLEHPERTTAEVRRDYARLVADHARRADGVIVPSVHVGRLVEGRLGVAPAAVSVCPHGVPAWKHADPVVPGNPAGRYILFLGTLEPRKNLPGLLEAYRRLLADHADVPPLVVAGGAGPAAEPWLRAMEQAPLAGHVEYRGYVQSQDREALLLGARMLVMPSFDEGFGLPLLEAMSLGIPVVAAERGALPEVAAGAALLVDPDAPASICAAMRRLLNEPGTAERLAQQGLDRAAEFTWKRTAELTRAAYERAIDRRAEQSIATRGAR